MSQVVSLHPWKRKQHLESANNQLLIDGVNAIADALTSVVNAILDAYQAAFNAAAAILQAAISGEPPTQATVWATPRRRSPRTTVRL